MNNSNYIINLLLKENGLPSKIKALQGSFDTLNKSVESVNHTINKVSADLSKDFQEINTTVNTTGETIKKSFKPADFVAFSNLTRNLAEGFTSLLVPSYSFEQNMASLSATTGITGKDLDELNRIARETGKASGAGAAEAANAFTALAAEVKVSKVGLEGLKTLQQETVTLAQAGGIGMTEAAGALAGTVSQFGLGADQANRVVNVLAAGARVGSAGIADLAASLKTSGEAAALNGVSVEQAAAAIEALSGKNLKGAEAGNALSGILTSMQEKLNIDLSQTGLSAALESLQPLVGNTSELTRIFGESNANAAQYLIDNASSVAQMTTALTDTNVAQEQAAIRSSTTAEQMERVRAKFDDLKISLFEATGGFTGYASAIADSAVTVSQLLPLLGGLKNLIFSGTQVTAASTVATKTKSVVEKTAAGITKLWTTVQRGFNLVMSANPIALLVTAGAALVGILVVAYNKFDKFRQVVNGVKEVASEFGSALISSVVEPFKTLLSGLSSVMGAMGSLVEGNFAEAADKAKEGLSKIMTSLPKLSPVGIIGNAVKNTDFSGAWDRGKNKSEEVVEVTADIETDQIQGEIEKALKEIPEIKIPVLTPVVAPGAIKSNPLETATEERKYTDKLQAPSFAVEAARPNIESIKQQMDALNTTLAENQVLTVNQGTVWDQLAEKMRGMGDATQPFVDGMKSLGQGMIQSFSKSADDMAGFAEQTANVIRDTISGVIALGVSYMVMNALKSASFGGPFGFLIAPALAALAGGLASSLFNSLIPSFANGGVVYGPTFAQVGEYPGAANNPEVIAPLNKLRNLIEPAQAGGGVYEFRLRGRDFVAVAAKYDTINNRTR